MVVSKDELETQLNSEKQQISEGRLKDENPLDDSEIFRALCEACRQGNIKRCTQLVNEGANVNGRDAFDYTPLILASLCGQYEVVQLLLECGALCQRDTFQGERCLYNALNNQIRSLLLRYDYSKSTHPLQPFASHINSLLSREQPKTSDITLSSSLRSFRLHKFVLAARSPYFRYKLAIAPGLETCRLSTNIPPQAVEIVMRFVYLGEISVDLGAGGVLSARERDILTAVDKLSRHLEMQGLWETLLEGGDRRIARQQRADEIVRCRAQMEDWYRDSVLKHKISIDTSKANDVRWDRQNSIFADVLLRADDDTMEDNAEEDDRQLEQDGAPVRPSHQLIPASHSIPIGPVSHSSRSSSRSRSSGTAVLFPAHRAMLIRSEYFLAMFSSSFREAQHTEHLQIIPIDCSPRVLEVILGFLYTEQAEFSVDIAIDVLLAADLLLMDRLKTRAAVVISTLDGAGKTSKAGMAGTSNGHNESHSDATSSLDEVISIYDVIRAGWLTRMRRLEEFGAKHLASRLEDYIDDDEFAELIRESATRISERQATDSIELLDDIRYHLSERFRFRDEDTGLEEMMKEDSQDISNGLQGSNHEFTSKESAGAAHTAAAAANSARLDGTSKPPASSDFAADEPSSATLVQPEDRDNARNESVSEAINYQILLAKIDTILERLKLDA